MVKQIVPEAVVRATSAYITSQIIVWVGNPEARRSHVSVQERVTRLSLDDKITLNAVLGLDTVLEEDGMTFRVVVYVANDAEVFDSVKGCASIEGIEEYIIHDVAVMNFAIHIEIDGITTHLTGLTDVLELNVRETADVRVVTRGVKQDKSTILFVS